MTARAKSGRKRASAPAATVAKAAPLLSPMTAAKKKSAQRSFEEGVMARGEAVLAGDALPPGATHEITGKRRDGTPVLKRKRFSVT